MADTVPHPAILTQADLERLTGYTRLADVEAELERQGIRFRRGRRGLWTTVDALNHSLGLNYNGKAEPRLIEF